MTYPAQRPLLPAITGPTTGMVSGGGARTGGRGPAADGARPVPGAGGRSDEPFARGMAVSRALAGGAVEAGAGGALGFGDGTAVSGRVGVRDRSRQWSSSHPSRDRLSWQWSASSPGSCSCAPDVASLQCRAVSDTAAATSSVPNRIENIDALANTSKSARLFSKSPPHRSYGRVRWDL